VSAALALLEQLDAKVYDKLEALGARLEQGLVDGAHKSGTPLRVQRVGSMITPFFASDEVRSFDEAVKSDTRRFGRWHAAMLSGGHYWPPSQFEAAFLSTAHTEAIVDETIAAAAEAFAAASS
jgi:glutamate-1-semialdehyde 2,1-aminomutase